MKYLISLSLFLAATQAFSESTSTGNQLAHFICQHSEFDHVLILEQVSVVPLDKGTTGGFDTIDGSVFIDADSPRTYTGKAKFRMKILDANFESLNFSDQSKEEIIKDLLARPAELGQDGKAMKYTGFGFRSLSRFVFISKDYGDFFRRVDISLEGEEYYRVSTNNGRKGYSNGARRQQARLGREITLGWRI